MVCWWCCWLAENHTHTHTIEPFISFSLLSLSVSDTFSPSLCKCTDHTQKHLENFTDRANLQTPYMRSWWRSTSTTIAISWLWNFVEKPWEPKSTVKCTVPLKEIVARFQAILRLKKVSILPPLLFWDDFWLRVWTSENTLKNGTSDLGTVHQLFNGRVFLWISSSQGAFEGPSHEPRSGSLVEFGRREAHIRRVAEVAGFSSLLRRDFVGIQGSKTGITRFFGP